MCMYVFMFKLPPHKIVNYYAQSKCLGPELAVPRSSSMQIFVRCQ